MADLYGWIVANKLDMVAFGVMEVERTPVNPNVFGELEFAAECFKPGALRVEIFAGDRESKMIDGRLGRTQSGIARLAVPIKESENLSVPAVTVRDFEESRIWKAPQQLQADNILIEGLHGI